MTYLQSYLLWSLSNIHDLFLTIGISCAVLGLILLFCYLFFWDECDWDKAKNIIRMKRTVLLAKIILPIFLFCLIACTFIPKTETVFKIIATKKGVDAIQSKTFEEVVNKTGTTINKMSEVVDSSLDLLNQEVKSKIKTKKER